jgi:Putative transposase
MIQKKLVRSGRCIEVRVFTESRSALQGALPREASGMQKLCANLQGFSLHAAVRCGAGQRKTLERLCRYITRPALANDRVQINAAGQVELKLKTPWRDGTTHQVMSPVWTTLLSREI